MKKNANLTSINTFFCRKSNLEPGHDKRSPEQYHRTDISAEKSTKDNYKEKYNEQSDSSTMSVPRVPAHHQAPAAGTGRELPVRKSKPNAAE